MKLDGIAGVTTGREGRFACGRKILMRIHDNRG
jgi:hypothetical protein